MGLVYAGMELINKDDTALAGRHMIGEEEVWRIHPRVQEPVVNPEHPNYAVLKMK
ncbi:hypothetical protein [Niabella aurantiaca]|uniref:hypothetical protein n=1 Tax=Niabella aurantiaca TaxID=379900 RepID=UPI000372FBB5|nr:hypothetical protein [Niabella aurantiaca]